MFYSKQFSEGGIHKVTIWPIKGEITIDHFTNEVRTPSINLLATTPTPANYSIPIPTESHNEGVPNSTIAGAVIGGVCGLLLISFSLFHCYRKQGKSSQEAVDGEPTTEAVPTYLAHAQDSFKAASGVILVPRALSRVYQNRAGDQRV